MLVLAALAPITAWSGDGSTEGSSKLTLTPEQVSAGLQARWTNVNHACWVHHPQGHENCDYSAPLQVLIIGNSHVWDGFNFMDAAYGDDTSVNLVMFGSTNFCTNLKQVPGRFISDNPGCQILLDSTFDPAVAGRFDLVLYSSNRPFAGNKADVLEILRRLKSINPEIKVMILGGYLNTREHCSELINASGTTDSCALAENVSYFASDPTRERFFKEFSALSDHYIDRVALLCENRELQSCMTRTEDGIPAIYDKHHHSLEFAQMSGKLYAKENPNLLYDLAGIDRAETD